MNGQPLIENRNSLPPSEPTRHLAVQVAHTSNFRINDEVACQFATNDMIFGVAHFIARMSQYLVLHPGDVLWMGADGPTLDIKAGDVVDVEIDGIGVLSNPVARAG